MYHVIRLAGYYWANIMADCLRVAKTCHRSQINGNFEHQPPLALHPTSEFHIASSLTMPRPRSGKMHRFMEKYKIKWNYSTGYYPQANGMIEVLNKTLGKILKKMVHRHRRDWHDRLFEDLWANRVTVCTPTQATILSCLFFDGATLLFVGVK